MCQNNKKCYNEHKLDNNCNQQFCVCGYCNHCHIGGFCPDHKYWYQHEGTGERSPILPGQSHGGHSWVPDCNNIH